MSRGLQPEPRPRSGSGADWADGAGASGPMMFWAVLNLGSLFPSFHFVSDDEWWLCYPRTHEDLTDLIIIWNITRKTRPSGQCSQYSLLVGFVAHLGLLWESEMCIKSWSTNIYIEGKKNIVRTFVFLLSRKGFIWRKTMLLILR